MGTNFSNQQRVITTRSQLDEAIDLFRQDQLISSFLEIAVGQTTETARRFLQTTDWNINEAIDLYLTNNISDSSIYHDNQVHNDSTTSGRSHDSDSIWSRPPLYLLQESSFVDAKSVSIENNLWLIVNLQSRTELASHTLNRDVWSNDAISQIVESNFNLWQVYDNTTEGQKISSFYKMESSPPVILVIDPITGQKMHMWSGVIEADSFVEGLMKFTDAGPHEHIASLTRNMRKETTETCLSSNNTYQPPAPSWGEEFEEEDTWSSRNNNNQVTAPSWEQKFEEQDAQETCLSSNNGYQTPAPSWGKEFEEDTWSSRNNNNQVAASSWEQEFEDQDAWETCLSRNNAYQTPAPSWGEEFEKEDTWSPRNNNNQVVAPSREQEFEDQDTWETWSSHSDSDDFVPPFMGDKYEESDEVKEDEACLEFPDLTDEPKGECDPSVVCSLCVRFPDGRRKQRKFLKSEPNQLLWSFCYSQMDESGKKAFKLVLAIPGASKTLDYGANATFDQSGLANSMISVTWE